MTFMSVVSKRAASEVVVEQVGVARVMLFEGSERGAELIAMMLTSPEDGVAVTSPATIMGGFAQAVAPAAERRRERE